MDKILALNYLAAAAAAKSFSGAARTHGVSVPAVARMINALEAHLGIALVERSARGLTLTAAGTGYLAACAPLVAELAAADDHARSSTARLKGTLVVGVQEVIAKGCLMSALPVFHGRYPDIEIDVRDFLSVTDEQVSGVDVMLMIGWPKAPDLVCRRVGESRFRILAAPSYWAAHGRTRRRSLPGLGRDAGSRCRRSGARTDGLASHRHATGQPALQRQQAANPEGAGLHRVHHRAFRGARPKPRPQRLRVFRACPSSASKGVRSRRKAQP